MTSLRKFLEAQGFERIPLQKLQTGHYQIRFSINGEKGTFILDSGASSSCVGFKDLFLFRLLSEETDIKAAGAGAINMETKMSKNNRLQIGGIVLKNVDFVLFDMTHVNEALQQAGEMPVHGILGADVLKKLRGVIDYGRNCVYFKN
ncbi:MAG TPA: retropepsin-like aspartic protease [Flavobacteriaceae bacterium]|nr:clan AA aspartic protease [Flavobacteriaceae bacterium]MCB9212213.1 clan AA aspartic protease [Alteromonas sp.]HPF10408.1 retropepsin-like aspartic protease [Flavobacteriaceae bacterium]HQU20472.1 retropepsin-like aspartic protease [Flavobacteriaceae bacterium]HQU64619.1 retropepsin-like aspartic protease [Flavobacteriaceae bacterium]